MFTVVMVMMNVIMLMVNFLVNLGDGDDVFMCRLREIMTIREGYFSGHSCFSLLFY